jgi:hypothetical protein
MAGASDAVKVGARDDGDAPTLSPVVDLSRIRAPSVPHPCRIRAASVPHPRRYGRIVGLAARERGGQAG